MRKNRTNNEDWTSYAVGAWTVMVAGATTALITELPWNLVVAAAACFLVPLLAGARLASLGRPVKAGKVFIGFAATLFLAYLAAAVLHPGVSPALAAKSFLFSLAAGGVCLASGLSLIERFKKAVPPNPLDGEDGPEG